MFSLASFHHYMILCIFYNNFYGKNNEQFDLEYFISKNKEKLQKRQCFKLHHRNSKENIFANFFFASGPFSQNFPNQFFSNWYFLNLYTELITGPVFTAKGRIRPFLGYLGHFWPVFGSQRQYS